ncbi:lysophospholipid acyltransferase family protein [Arthrobacter sunyaminii]|uniref:1-acyl-sn-glycerol-3-phosphate acyltransferase n=1 Tax=Arthrobacter sunyaminii TaxID=2816859 RepID=A0A975S3M2_9MICC|nr:1-acyl-sn-glycerol-3-phosphate acyltransferase [Arthrobacter sunyaminii]MBO0907123.1 1-acyl-sn-glycerol-3-phosphate acyltransferase [Arthrobacter sunyaminii]QWQ34750.1 1-acyl-sn-glycerol-3-phosphate acyltransferase [Arthrobacter sunyaminii]
MTLKFPPNKYVYRSIVLTGIASTKVFRIPVLPSGLENLPRDEEIHGLTRTAVPGKGAVVAITHFGYLDFVFAEYLVWKKLRAHMRFLVTKKAARKPFVKAVCEMCEHIIVDRSNGAAAYTESVEALRRGEYLAVLPEAGVSRSFSVRKLKTGAVRMAAEAGVPIIPVSVWGSHRMLTRGGHGLSLKSVWKNPVRIHVSPMMRVAPDASVPEATELLQKTLQAGMDHCIDTYPVKPEPGAWWMPVSRGGSAMTVEEQLILDEQDREKYKITG